MPDLNFDHDAHDDRSARPVTQPASEDEVPPYTYANASHPEIARCVERLNSWSRLIRYRASAILIDAYTGRILLVNFDRRQGTIGRWTFASGGAKQDETVNEDVGNGRREIFAAVTAAIRESREEAGVWSAECEGRVVDGVRQSGGPIKMAPMLRKKRGTTTYYVFLIKDLEVLFHEHDMFSHRANADQQCIRSFQFVQFPYITFAHCFRDVFPVLTSIYKQYPALLTPKVDLADFDLTGFRGAAFPSPPHVRENIGVQDPRVNPMHVDGDSLFDFVKNEGSAQKQLRQSSEWSDLKKDFKDLLKAVPPALFTRLWIEGPDEVFPESSNDPIHSKSSLICQMVFGVTNQMHLMNYKGLSWLGMKVNEDLLDAGQKACWSELVSCAQISMPREGEGSPWKIMIDDTILQRSPAMQVLLNTQVGAVATPMCSKALEYLDYEVKCAGEANEIRRSQMAERGANTVMPPVVEEFVKVFNNSVKDFDKNEVMDQDCDYTKYGEYVEHMVRHKDKDGKEVHGGKSSLARGNPIPEMMKSLMTTVPRCIRVLHKMLIKHDSWPRLCIRADQRVKQQSLESYLKADTTVGSAFKELMQALRSAFTKAPRWYPEDMRYFLNAICNGPDRLRGVCGMGPVVDLMLNLAWREVWNSRYIMGCSAELNPIGIYIPNGRRPDRLAYVENELQEPWADLWEWREN